MSPTPPTSSTSDAQAVDLSELLGRCMGNFKMIERVLATFLVTGKSDLDRLSCAIESGDFQAASEFSHRLHGAAGNVSAIRLRVLLKETERLAAERCRAESLMMLGRLVSEWENFERFVAGFVAAPGTSAGGSCAMSQSQLEACHAGACR